MMTVAKAKSKLHRLGYRFIGRRHERQLLPRTSARGQAPSG
jgi:hypothetical protein